MSFRGEESSYKFIKSLKDVFTQKERPLDIDKTLIRRPFFSSGSGGIFFI